MTGASELSKLAELRAKTDRELAAIIHKRLDRALSPSDPRVAEAERLLRAIENPIERQRLETKLRQLRKPAADYATA